MKRLQPSVPRSPFSTRLSGSARETELRIRNLFQGPKKRPPVLLMALAALVILFCGSLVSCQPKEQRLTPEVIMDVQYYDTNENYIEIPMLALPGSQEPNEAITAINQALADLKAEYQPILDGAAGGSGYGLDGLENHCLLYPSTTDRYLNLLFFREQFVTDLNTGHVFSLVYDKEEARQVTLEDALELAGVTEDALFSQLSEQFDGYVNPDLYAYIQNPVLEAFRMGTDGQPIFYLTARMDDDPANDWLSGADNVYIWQNGEFTCYDQYASADLQPLVPAGETDRLDPPLWCQWYFEGGEPEGGFVPSPYSGDSSEEASEPSAPPEDGSNSTTPDTPDDGGMRTAYADILERLIQDDVAPGGESPALYADDPEFNKFALYDVDGDGKKELVLLYAAQVYAGYSGYVLAYNETTKTVDTQLVEFPNLTFYDNGAVKAGWSHNQGWGGRFWPYNLYQYEPGSDRYTMVAMVDAWDREISDNNEGFTPFPTELDTSGTGFLYYIYSNAEEYGESDPVDASVYNAWLNTYIGGASELDLPYLTLNEENIQRLRTGS